MNNNKSSIQIVPIDSILKKQSHPSSQIKYLINNNIKSYAWPETTQRNYIRQHITSIWSNFDQNSTNIFQISCYSFIMLQQATLEKMEQQKTVLILPQNSPFGTIVAPQGQMHRQVQEFDFISQYLSLKSGTSQFRDQQSHQNCKQSEKSEKNASESQTDSPNAPHAIKYGRKPSEFHNFQKHLMTTLKKFIKMKRTANSDRSKSNIASQLWEYFINRSKCCKRQLLYLLLGSTGEKQTKHQSKFNEQNEKMLAYFSEYTEKEIKAAQQYLTRQVVRQSSKLLQSNSFQNRRINKTDDFKNYFQLFIAGLMEGKINLRLPKQLKNVQENKIDFLLLRSQSL